MSNDNTNNLNNEFAGITENLGELSTEDEAAIEKALKHIASQMTDSSESYEAQHNIQPETEEKELSKEAEAETLPEDSTNSLNENTEQEDADKVSLNNDEVLEENEQKELADEVPENADTNKDANTSLEIESETKADVAPEPEPETAAEIVTEAETENENKDEAKAETNNENEAETTAETSNVEEQGATENNEVEDNSSEEVQNVAENIPYVDEFGDNEVVKKYIIYISKDFVPFIDNLSADERSAYINDAIQQKIDTQNTNKLILERKKIAAHIIIAIAVIIISMPIAILIAHKSIMVTFENYKYSQDSFEKLYQHRFKQDSAYLRSIEYNKEYEKRLKAQQKTKNN